MPYTKRIGVFPGSFDPITLGHEDIVLRSLSLFDEVIIAIGTNSAKNYMFSLEQRMQMINDVFAHESRVKVETFTGLTADYCRSKNINYILRGLRTSSDFEFERAIGQMNKAMFSDLETVFYLSDPRLSAINSTIVRDILKNGGNAKQFLPQKLDLSNY